MAKQLKNIFNAGTDEIQQSFIINAAHVSQSTDAFTGVDDYSIAISGTFQMIDGVATFATGDYLSGGGIVFSGNSGSVSSPSLALYVSNDLQTANILADKQKLFIRNGNREAGRGNVVIQVDQPGSSSTDIFEIAVFGSESLGTQLYHTGSLVFYTDSGSSGLGIVSTGYVSGSKAYLPGTDNLEQNYVVGFDSTTGEFTYFSTSSISLSGSSNLSGVTGGGCTKYDIVLSTDTGSTPSSGQAIFISGSVYGDNDTYGVIRIHEEDANGDNVNNFLGTTFESKQFNIHWVSSSLITTEANSSGQRFNQSVTIVTDISCSTEPAPGDPGDSGSIDPPPYVSPSSSGVGPISMVYSETLQGLKTGGTAVSLVDIYLDPLFVYADLSDTGSSAVFQTQVFRRDNLAFATEYTSESIMAYANTYLNSSQFSFDPSIYDGTQTPYLYRTASMSSEAPVGYYIFASEYTDVNLLKNAAKYEGSGSFNSKFPGWNYTPPAPTPPADPTTITKCTITTQTLAVSKSGDYWEIPWELDAYSGSYAPTSFSSSYMCFDADGSYSTLGGSEGIGGSGGGSTGATETLTALGYDDSTKLLAYVDEELAINIRDLNSAGNLDFKLNGGSTISEASILNLIEGDNVSITLTESPSGTAAYAISASNSPAITGSYTGSVLTNTISSINWTGSGVNATNVGDDLTIYIPGDSTIDTGSFYISSSVEGNVITFTQGNGTTPQITIDTGSTDTGSFLTTASISDATITFTKGNGSTFDIEVNNVTSSISSSYVANAFYSGSVHGNILTFTQFDGDISSLIVETGSGATDTGSLMVTGSVDGNILTFEKGDGSTFNLTVTTGSGATDTGSLLVTSSLTDNVMTFEKGDATTYDIDLSGVFVDEALRTAITIKNVSAGAITKGTPCYITASGTSGNVVGVLPADAGDPDFMPAGVVAGEDLASTGDEGIGYIAGWINGVDTSAFTSGDDVYVAVGGGYTNVKPTGSALIQKLGNVEKSDAVAGSGVITGAGRANDLPNLTSGSFWVGNSDSVPVVIPTASFTASNAITASYAPNLYNADGTLTDARVVTSNGNSLTFDMTTANFVINSDPSQSIIFNDLPTQDNPQVLGIDASGIIKAMNTSSIAGGGTTDTGSLLITGSVSSNIITLEKGDGSTFDLTIDTGSNSIPDTPLNSFQFNSSSEFGGSEMYYDEATQRVGINISTPQADLHVRGANNGTGSILLETDSTGEEEEAFAALYFRVADNDGANYKKFAVIAENTGSAYGVGRLHLALNSDDSGVGNATIADSKLTIDHTGSVFMPNIDTASQAYIIGYDSASGELTYFSTASFGGGGSIDTGSLLTTASISDATITFTKGDASTFDIEVNNVTSSISSSYALSSSYAPNLYNSNGNLLSTRTLDFATNDLTFDILQGETFQTVLDVGATHSIRIDEGMFQILSGSGFAELASPHLLTYDTASGRVQYMSTASFESSIDTGSFYVSSSMISGNQIRFYQGDGSNENVTISVNPGGVYDVDTRSTGTSQFSTTLETIIGSTTIPSGSTTQSVRISEIANLSLGNQVHITATLYGNEATYGNKQVYVFQNGGGNSFPGTIDANGDIIFRVDVAPTNALPVMYHVMYTTDNPSD